MITHKKATYTLTIGTLLKIDDLIELGGLKITKSSLIKDCLLENFELFEKELIDNGGIPLSMTYSFPKKFSNTQPITITLPFEVVERLNYFSKKLGIKKSHLVMCSIDLHHCN